VLGLNPEEVTVFWRDAAWAPTAHRLLGSADGVGNTETLLCFINKLLIETALFEMSTLTWKMYGKGMDPPK
jgi:hypothetical protein